MTVSSDLASRLRLAFRALLAAYQQRSRDLLRPQQLVKGSVYELQTRCGKPSCHCASPSGPLHATTVLSWSHRGRTRLQTLRVSDRARLRRFAEQYRRFRRARAALGKLHRQMLQTVDRLERVLLQAPPAPVTRKRKR